MKLEVEVEVKVCETLPRQNISCNSGTRSDKSYTLLTAVARGCNFGPHALGQA